MSDFPKTIFGYPVEIVESLGEKTGPPVILGEFPRQIILPALSPRANRLASRKWVRKYRVMARSRSNKTK